MYSVQCWNWEGFPNYDHKEGWALVNWCFLTVVLEKTLESPLDSKEIKPANPKGNQLYIHWKDWCWSGSSNSLATWCKELTHWKRLWCWEKLKAGREGGDRGWDGWMASPTQWTWVWVDSGNWWWTGRLGVLRFMGSQRVRYDWATELNSMLWKCPVSLTGTSTIYLFNGNFFSTKDTQSLSTHWHIDFFSVQITVHNSHEWDLISSLWY